MLCFFVYLYTFCLVTNENCGVFYSSNNKD